MKRNRSVLYFVICSFSFYLAFSVLAYLIDLKWQPFKNVNLIAAILKEKKLVVKNNISPSIPAPVIAFKPHYNFQLYNQAHLITNFDADTSQPALTAFLQKLYELKTGKKRKVRVAYFGDSMIEGDLLTKTLRALLQKEFSGAGVGFVPITSPVSQFRQTVNTSYSTGWQRESFKSDGAKNKLFLSGYQFHGHDDWVQMQDETTLDSTVLTEKSLLCGYYKTPLTIKVNDIAIQINPDRIFNRIVVSNNANKNLKLFIADARLPVYGLSFESASGIIVDNFAFRGISGVELNAIDTAFLNKIEEATPYDLIIFQYGVNVLFEPDDVNFNWYGRLLRPVIKKLRDCFPSANLLIVSSADRAFKYNNVYESAIGIDSLIKVQAAIAYQTGAGFYNQYQTMGGQNSIVDWANRTPPLANKDYVHPNNKGAAILGNYFFDAVMNDYRKFITQSHKNAPKN